MHVLPDLSSNDEPWLNIHALDELPSIPLTLSAEPLGYDLSDYSLLVYITPLIVYLSVVLVLTLNVL